VEGDRAKAIALAVGTAREGDIILIAGKGHEDYQIIGNEKRSFDDRLEAEAAIKLRGSREHRVG
jgi:UDP-N-acetylmuramoyl-L-alanyl-D-glutamate--2,6-diaminopimelate ligase